MLLCLLLSFSLHAQDINDFRDLYLKAQKERSSNDRLQKKIKSLDVQKGVHKAYLGSSYFFSASFSYNPIKKFDYFNTGKRLIDKAVKMDPDNIEIRFLRFAAQAECPSFLGYNDHLREDKRIILNGLPYLKDYKLKKMILDYLRTCEKLSTEEKKELK